eukprot:NODE_668_length_1995_cov_8142.648510_g79_i3.p8 GENE.NODE_668_length_1995_cov_8142.648510_g79_i3~~NODE_668_length_1995_cov_8142.648510_g79_i3.p8  ORF type:complete len:113 (-),score=0.22 NODE_668_length_1995_cov_8142.648510_g79_i3:1263-1601(-)
MGGVGIGGYPSGSFSADFLSLFFSLSLSLARFLPYGCCSLRDCCAGRPGVRSRSLSLAFFFLSSGDAASRSQGGDRRGVMPPPLAPCSTRTISGFLERDRKLLLIFSIHVYT